MTGYTGAEVINDWLYWSILVDSIEDDSLFFLTDWCGSGSLLMGRSISDQVIG